MKRSPHDISRSFRFDVPALAAAFLIAAAASTLGFPASAQVAESVAPDYGHEVWTTEQGLPQNIVVDLVQTRDGYLWVATGNGLARFDGVRFEVFDMSNTPELPSGWLTKLFEDAEGVLWIGTDAGLARYRDGSFAREDLGVAPHQPGVRSTPIPSAQIQSITQDPAGRLWVATARRVLRREDAGWRSIPLGDVGVVNDLLVDSEGMLWIGTESGLIQWHGRRRRTLRAIEGLFDDQTWPVHEDDAGNVWVRGWRGLVRIDRETGDVEPAPGALADAFVNGVFEGSDGRLWIGAHGTLFALDRANHLSAYPVTVAGEEEVQTITQDREGQLWFGVSGGRAGLHRLSPRRVEVLARERGLPCDNASAVTQAADGTVWVGLLCRGAASLVALRDGRVVASYGGSHGGAPANVASLLALAEGDLWMGTFGDELFHLENGRFTRYTHEDGWIGNVPATLYRDEQGALWVGTQHGLNRYHDGRWRTFTTRDGLVHDDVRFITADAEGALWIGTGGGISRYVGGRFVNLTSADGLPSGPVRAIHVDAEGTVWMGTYGGGLARLKDGKVTAFGTQGGLLDNSVHRILEDDYGYLWLSGDRGIRRASRSELNDFAEGRTARLSVDIFDERDGMKNAEANGMGQPAGWKMRDGSLWFPTQGGLVRVDPAAVEQTAAAPPLVIERVLVDGTAYDPRRAVEVPPGADELEIHYTAPAFTRPEQIQFRYRLRGHDDGWIDAGTRRVAHYANLRPGSYRFELRARSAAGVWNEEGAALDLALLPHFYQRPAFRLAAALLVGLGVYLASRLRVAGLRRRAEALEAVVADRTAELRREREGLSEANRRLGDTNERLHAAKQTVEASHTHLLSVLDQLRIGVIAINADERVLFASSATSRLVDGDGLAGKSLSEVLPIPAAAMAEVRQRLATPRPGARTPARLEPRSGQRYWAEIEVCVDPRDGEHRILYLYDVTEAYDLKHQAAAGADGATARLIGTSPAIKLVHAYIHTVAGVDTTVVIEGETGTGKELVARAIHEASRRRKQRFVAINCAGLTESLLASQLFGHRRGAFTGAVSDHVGLFEAAQGGTLLLDEIGDMPLAMQTHLLRVLQEREIIRVGDTRPRPIDVRVLASTHRNLEQEVAAGRFREDLLYRIRVARILLPPLRQRPEDIPHLAAAFLADLAAEHGKTLNGFGREAMERLERHDWPGNVRELKSVVEWAAIHAGGPVIKLADLPPELATDGVPPPSQRATMPEPERQLLIETLKRTGGNRTVAARLLGISRATLYRRLAALDKAGEAYSGQ